MITIISHTEANGSHPKPIQKLPDMYTHCNEIHFLLGFPYLEFFFSFVCKGKTIINH